MIVDWTWYFEIMIDMIYLIMAKVVIGDILEIHFWYSLGNYCMKILKLNSSEWELLTVHFIGNGVLVILKSSKLNEMILSDNNQEIISHIMIVFSDLEWEDWWETKLLCTLDHVKYVSINEDLGICANKEIDFLLEKQIKFLLINYNDKFK